MENVKESQLLAKWTQINTDNQLQLCTFKSLPISPPILHQSITVTADLSWHVPAAGKLVTKDVCKLLRHLPEQVNTIKCLEEIAQIVECAVICPGNADMAFVDLATRRGGSFQSACVMQVAYSDSSSEVLCGNGQVVGCTIRHHDCEVLCECISCYPKHCSRCVCYRTQLQVMPSRDQPSTSNRTAHDSHTNYRYLSKEETI